MEVLHIRVSDLLPGCTNWVLNLLHAIHTENLHTLVFELWLVHPKTLEEEVWQDGGHGELRLRVLRRGRRVVVEGCVEGSLRRAEVGLEGRCRVC